MKMHSKTVLLSVFIIAVSLSYKVLPAESKEVAKVQAPQSSITWPEYQALLLKLAESDSYIKEELKCFCYDEEHRYDCTDEVFATIAPSITMPTEQIRQKLDHYNAIVNRKPESDILIIGCGNLLPHIEGINVEQIENYDGGDVYHYRVLHGHKNCDTIDPNWAKNPTIVAMFGTSDISGIFEGHRYKQIICEGVNISPHQYSTKILNDLLDDQGTVRIDFGEGRFFSITKQDLAEKISVGEPLLLEEESNPNWREIKVLDWDQYSDLLYSASGWDNDLRVGRKCYDKDGELTTCSEDIFATILPHITVPFEQLRKSERRYKAIIHRQPVNDTLIIGCGNLLPHTEHNVEFIDDQRVGGSRYDYRAAHKHEHCDTIDTDWAKNPTIVAKFGVKDMRPLFRGHRYKKIIIERTNPDVGRECFGYEESYAQKLLYDLLDDDGVLLFDKGEGPYGRVTKEELKEILEKNQWLMWPNK